MRIRTPVSAVAFLVGIAGYAHAAQTIVSAGLPTSTNTSAACYVRNIGSRPVTVSLTASVNYTAPVQPSFENCSRAPLDAGHSCVLLVDELDDDVTFACAAVIGGSAKSVRGNVEIRQIAPFPRVVAAERMR